MFLGGFYDGEGVAENRNKNMFLVSGRGVRDHEPITGLVGV